MDNLIDEGLNKILRNYDGKIKDHIDSIMFEVRDLHFRACEFAEKGNYDKARQNDVQAARACEKLGQYSEAAHYFLSAAKHTDDSKTLVILYDFALEAYKECNAFSEIGLFKKRAITALRAAQAYGKIKYLDYEGIERAYDLTEDARRFARQGDLHNDELYFREYNKTIEILKPKFKARWEKRIRARQRAEQEERRKLKEVRKYIKEQERELASKSL